MDAIVSHRPATPFPLRPHILVVDDEPTICTVVRRVLTSASYEVETATQATNALQMLHARHFDLLITDINMPELSGLDLAAQARAENTELGVVIMTGYGSPENMTQAIRTGVADFITKPFDLEDLRRIVARALERQQLQRDNVRLQTLVRVFEVTRTMTGTLEMQALQRIVCETLEREVGVYNVHMLVRDDRQALLIGDHVPESVAVLALAAYKQREIQRLESQDATRAITVAMPMIAPTNECVGVLVITYDTPQSPIAAEMISIIVQQATLAIGNARQFEALRDLDRLKSDFIGIISHELRTPLSLVLGYSSLLRHHVRGRERETVEQVINGARRIRDIVDDLVSLRAVEDGQADRERIRFDLWDMVREVIAEMQPLAASHEIALDGSVPRVALPVLADRDTIELALAHLVDNALRFTEGGGRVSVVGRMPAPPSQPDITIEVYDTGIGIAQRDLRQIFDRFYQVAPTNTRARNGLGIGLALVKLWIERHGGRVEVESHVHRGSVFRVVLPTSLLIEPGAE